MQNITSPGATPGPFKGAKVRRYVMYFLIAIFAYLAGDQKILSTVLDEIGLDFNNHSTSNNQINHSSEQESADKIYFVGKYKVTHVVDGDTFDFLNEEGKKDTVRIMAVNTLEMKETDQTKLCFAKIQKQNTLAIATYPQCRIPIYKRSEQ